jgi:hypothetical protein
MPKNGSKDGLVEMTRPGSYRLQREDGSEVPNSWNDDELRPFYKLVNFVVHFCLLPAALYSVEGLYYVLIIYVIPRSEKMEPKPLYVCPRCSNHTYSNNMIKQSNISYIMTRRSKKDYINAPKN